MTGPLKSCITCAHVEDVQRGMRLYCRVAVHSQSCTSARDERGPCKPKGILWTPKEPHDAQAQTGPR